MIGWIFKSKTLRDHIKHYSQEQLSKWWWDVSVRVVTPVILGSLLIYSLVEEISRPYEGYSWIALILIGRDWLIVTLFFAIIIANYGWKVEPKHKMLKH